MADAGADEAALEVAGAMDEVSVMPYDAEHSSASPRTGVEQRKETHDSSTTRASGSLSLVKIAASA